MVPVQIRVHLRALPIDLAVAVDHLEGRVILHELLLAALGWAAGPARRRRRRGGADGVASWSSRPRTLGAPRGRRTGCPRCGAVDCRFFASVLLAASLPSRRRAKKAKAQCKLPRSWLCELSMIGSLRNAALVPRKHRCASFCIQPAEDANVSARSARAAQHRTSARLELHQERRRKEALKRQKDARSDRSNRFRALEPEPPIEVDQQLTKAQRKKQRAFDEARQRAERWSGELCSYDWLCDIPDELNGTNTSEGWFCMPRPEGQKSRPSSLEGQGRYRDKRVEIGCTSSLVIAYQVDQ